MTDTITKRIREIRRRLAEKFDNDLSKIVEDSKSRQHDSGHPMIDRSIETTSPVKN